MGVAQGSELIRKVITTLANVNDTVVVDDLVMGDEACILADSAYYTHAREKALKADAPGQQSTSAAFTTACPL